MDSPFSASLSGLMACIDESQDTLAYIRDAMRVQSSLGKAIDWQGEQTFEKRLASEFMKRSSPSLRITRNGLYVTLIASFEQFLRETIIVAVQSKVASAKRFGDLGDSFIKLHMDYSGRLLSMVHRPPAHLGINFFDLCARLGTCQQDSTDFRVNEVAFGTVKGITELDSLFEHLTALGFPIEWDDLGRRSDIQALLQTTRTCDASKELARVFVKATEMRNRIAHLGHTVADVDDGVLNRISNIIRCTATAISAHLASTMEGSPKSPSNITARKPHRG